DALIAPCANQTADALAKLQNRLRQRKLAEGIPAARLNRFDARFNEWMVRNRKRQARDDDVRKCLSGNIDPLPEAVSAKKDGIDILFEFFQHHRARRAGALDETSQP